MPGVTTRFDFAPLEQLLAREWAGPNTSMHPTEHSAQAIAVRLHIPVHRVHRYRNAGVPLRIADTLATHLNLHPTYVWDNY